MNPAWRLTTCLWLLSTAAIPVCAQQVYKWTDANGQVHFSDQPPPDTHSAEVVGEKSRIAPAPPPSGERAQAAPPAESAPDPMAEAERKRDEECARRAVARQEADKKIIDRCNANHETYCSEGVEGIRRAEFNRDLRAYQAAMDARQRGDRSGRVPVPPQYIPEGTRTWESQMDLCANVGKKKR